MPRNLANVQRGWVAQPGDGAKLHRDRMPDANHDDTVDCDEVEENENEEEGEEGEKQGGDDSPRGESCAGVLAFAWAVCAFAFSTCTQNGRLAARFIGSVCTHRMQTRRSAIQVTMVGSSV